MSETPTPSTAPSIEAARKMGAEGSPAVEAERLAFEAWMDGHCWSPDDVFWTGAQYLSPAERDGIVDAYAVQIRRMWAAWRDRAALAADALTAERAARERAEAERDALRARIRDDSLAMTCQSVGQYRTALLAKEGA